MTKKQIRERIAKMLADLDNESYIDDVIYGKMLALHEVYNMLLIDALEELEKKEEEECMN